VDLVYKFYYLGVCYLGKMFSADGNVGTAVETSIPIGWLYS